MHQQSDFIILIDALRSDDLDEEVTPFLWQLSSRGSHAAVIETCAFQTRPAFFAGLEPEASDICHLFEYNPELSPFRFIRRWRFLAEGGERISRRATRSVVRRIARRIDLQRGFGASAKVLDCCAIPFRLLPFFASSERYFTDQPDIFPGRATLFDRFRAVGKSWKWIGYPRHYGSVEAVLKGLKESTPADVVYLHFSELDWIGHRNGPHSVEGRKFLERLDKILSDLIRPALENGRRAVVFGDHGMAAVERIVDINKRLDCLTLRPGRDYVYFLDSTQARFWFLQPRSEGPIREVLEGLPVGHVLEAEERKRLGLNFSHNRFGDLIFALSGGVIIHPSFFADGRAAPKGMHGYLPDVLANRTQVIVCGAGVQQVELGTIPMTRIYGMMLEALLRENQPGTM